MSSFKKILAPTLALTLVAGCSTSSSSTATSSSSSGGEGSTVTIATDTDLNTMDYEIATDGTSFTMLGLCMSGLTELDKNGVPQPELAESWDISEDGLTYTFHLADAKWSNGDTVTAADFVYAWQRLCNPDTASEYAFILDTIHVKNAAAINAGEMDVSELGVKAVDDKTLEVSLTLPCDFMLSLMEFPSFYPLQQKFYEEKGDQFALSESDLLYCGPYTMTEFTTGSQYTFTRNENYFKYDEVKDEVETITFKFLQDTQSAMLDYEAGNIDIVNLTGEQVDQYKDSEGFTSRLQGFLWYLSINFDSEKYAGNEDFSNLNFRKALSYGIDRETICESVLKDGSVAAEGIIPNKFATGPDGKSYREGVGKLIEYDKDKAQEYYDKAVEELGHDVSFELLFEDSQSAKAVAEYIQSDLEALGMTVTLVSKPKKTRLELMNDSDYQVALTRWGPDYSDPQTYLDLFVSANASNNSGSYENAEYDALVVAADTGEDATDSEKRWQDYVEAEKILVVDDPGVIPVYQNGGATMINPAISGVVYLSVGGNAYRHMKKA